MSSSATARKPARPSLPVPVARRPPRVAVGSRPHGVSAGDLVKLHHSLAEALDADRGLVVQFVSPETGAGTERIVYDLAYISTAWLGKRVLFVNGSSMQLDKHAPIVPRRREPLKNGAAVDLSAVERSITRVVGTELYQMTLPTMNGALDLAPTIKQIPDFIGRLRQAFDFVVIASPPASSAPMGVLLSRFVDGNIIVLESGKTRAPEAMELRESLSASGGTVVGVVLTKYRSFAPRFLRRWL